MSKMTLAELVEEVSRRQAALEAAEQRTSIAHNDETECLNQLNATQKAIDAAVEELRKGAPRDSEWKRTRGVPVP